MYKNERKDFENYLLEKNKITHDQYQQVLTYADKHREAKTSEILYNLQIMDREEVLIELAGFLDKKYVLLDSLTMPQLLKDTFNEEFMLTNNFAPFEIEQNIIKVAIADINNVELKSDIDLIAGRKNYTTEYYLSLADMIKQYIELSFIDKASSGKDIPHLVDLIIEEGIRKNSSDIHFEPINQDKVRVRYRIDGQMVPTGFFIPRNEYDEVVSRVKVMGNLNTTEKRRAQDGHISDFKSNDGRVFDIRISIALIAYGEKIVLRLLNKSERIKELKELGFNDSQISVINRNIRHKNGVVFVTGATGTGKSTTLYTILSILNKESANIITIENPVERTVEGLNQININENIGISFSNTLRTVLRQDPDIIMVGEIRDKETLSLALEASMTGHLVLTTLHTNSAIQIIDRINSMGIDIYNFTSSLLLVMSQKLIRKLCPHCKKGYLPPKEELEYIQTALGIEADENTKLLYKGAGCSRCHQGYLGREVICEMFEKDEYIERLLIDKASSTEVLEYLNTKEYIPIKHQAIQKVLNGITSLEEVRNLFAD